MVISIPLQFHICDIRKILRPFQFKDKMCVIQPVPEELCPEDREKCGPKDLGMWKVSSSDEQQGSY
jgi:hypothetical protein